MNHQTIEQRKAAFAAAKNNRPNLPNIPAPEMDAMVDGYAYQYGGKETKVVYGGVYVGSGAFSREMEHYTNVSVTKEPVTGSKYCKGVRLLFYNGEWEQIDKAGYYEHISKVENTWNMDNNIGGYQVFFAQFPELEKTIRQCGASLGMVKWAFLRHNSEYARRVVSAISDSVEDGQSYVRGGLNALNPNKERIWVNGVITEGPNFQQVKAIRELFTEIYGTF
jgi:hypothetical protein